MNLPVVLFVLAVMLAATSITVPALMFQAGVSAWIGRSIGHPVPWKIGGLLVFYLPALLLLLSSFVIARRRGLIK